MYNSLENTLKTSPAKVKNKLYELLYEYLPESTNQETLILIMNFILKCYQTNEKKIFSTLLNIISEIENVPDTAVSDFASIIENLIETMDKKNKKTCRTKLFLLLESDNSDSDSDMNTK